MMHVNNNTIKNLVVKVAVFVDVMENKNVKIIQINVLISKNGVNVIKNGLVMFVKKHVEHVIEVLVIQNVLK